MDLSEWLAKMPKAELHIHIEGALEPRLVRKIAERNKLKVPPSSTERTEGYDFHDLTSFLAVYYPNLAVLQTADDFYDLAWEYFSRVHQDNVLHVEMFFDPQAHTSRGVPFHTFLSGYRRAIVQAERELGMSVSLILCFMRDLDAGFAMATLMEALPYKEWIIGVGLDSDERDNPPSKFSAVFERARLEGFLITMHCDIDQHNSIEHIRQAIEDLGTNRIDHGENIVEDPRLVQLVKEKGIGLTCTPVSNSVVSKDFKGREIVALLRQGVKTTISSDDPAYFRAYMTDNMVKMTDGIDITKQELVQLQRNAFEISWISNSKRQEFLALLDDFASKN